MGRFDELGRALRLARLEQGRKQAEVAELAGISKSTLSKYETAAQYPTLATLDRLLDALGLTLTELEQRLGGTHHRERQNW
jgi:transcriptional regulator with XRE-family HTH domain